MAHHPSPAFISYWPPSTNLGKLISFFRDTTLLLDLYYLFQAIWSGLCFQAGSSDLYPYGVAYGSFYKSKPTLLETLSDSLSHQVQSRCFGLEHKACKAQDAGSPPTLFLTPSVGPITCHFVPYYLSKTLHSARPAQATPSSKTSFLSPFSTPSEIYSSKNSLSGRHSLAASAPPTHTSHTHSSQLSLCFSFLGSPPSFFHNKLIHMCILST